MKNHVSLSDQELIELYVNGNCNAIETLIYRHKDKVYACIFNIVRDKNTADDVFQEVFLKAIDKLRLGQYKHENKFLHWLMRIAYNQCMDVFRGKRRVITIQESAEEWPAPAAGGGNFGCRNTVRRTGPDTAPAHS